MNLKTLAARFAELHPQYRYDTTNHVWVVADPSADGGYVLPTNGRIIGDEVQALTVAMVDANNADNARRSKRPWQYDHMELFRPLRAACGVRMPKRDLQWADAEPLAKLEGWRVVITTHRGRPSLCADTRMGMPWIEVNVAEESFGGGWFAYACGTAIHATGPERQTGVCRLDVLRRLLAAAPWLLKGLTGPEAV